ncbi:DEAD/DEAH box helicase [Flavobacterium sp. DG1-102-2]|uniref:DEAD/DEAH box helicase n=1 Tax=Flavobacterium sp. DG1-102-2 TaxID=3081663 RepID=UPI00294A0B88|nr:DEAD/DEAH box helicase [Flavobacterium sp. DG1-102-2]MDV6169839.1 DEAD/DEAH box helicase [Flavobacterium sp. DG1-102-2]
MFLKKINENLNRALEEAGLTEPTELQKETWGTIKSGADCVFLADSELGKTTTIVINVIQRLEKEFEESPRALIFVKDKAKVLEMLEMFKKYGNHTDLRVYGVYEQGDIDYDKNQISLGIDVLIGSTNRLNDMFSTAGFDVNQLKMFIVDDTEDQLKVRMDTKITRISNSITKTQRLFFTDVITDRVEALADRIMIEPVFFEFDDEGEDEEYEEEEGEEENNN